MIIVIVGAPEIIDKSHTPTCEIMMRHTRILWCSARGYPMPDIQWLFDNKNINEQEDLAWFTVQQQKGNKRDLTIHASFEMVGELSCVASNSLGKDRYDVEIKARQGRLILYRGVW